MSGDDFVKKSGFLEGAFVASIAIIITKVLGLLYVIPFHNLVGAQGGALYGYAYNIYTLFLIISSAGIPLAISKITSEYDTLGKHEEKNYVFKYIKNFLFIFSIGSFLICFFGAPLFAKALIGNMTGGNTIKEVTNVIRSVSFALLIVPFLSIYRGFLQGQKYIAASSFSQVIEQLARIFVILVGSYVIVKVFKLPLSYAINISVFAAFVGAIFAFFYLKFKSRDVMPKEVVTLPKDEKKVVVKKLFEYAIPFVIVSLTFSLYSTTDMFLLIKGLNFIGYSQVDIETISGVFTTWGYKLSSMVTAIATGLVISLIPSMVSAYTKKDLKEVNNQFKKVNQILFLVILPLSIFLSIYAKEVWFIFYGASYFGPIIFKFKIFSTFLDSIYLIMGSILQNLSKRKLLYKSIFWGLGVNAILDIPLILLFNKIGIYPYYGAIVATMIGYIITISIIVTNLKKDEGISYNLKNILKNILLTLIILIPINLIVRYFVFSFITSRLLTILAITITGLVSLVIYYLINKDLLIEMFGEKFIKRALFFKK